MADASSLSAARKAATKLAPVDDGNFSRPAGIDKGRRCPVAAHEPPQPGRYRGGEDHHAGGHQPHALGIQREALARPLPDALQRLDVPFALARPAAAIAPQAHRGIRPRA